ncbi:50S ribosomal protein L4 [Spirulina sp. CCNP1310]|uniref:50S ribosomal protein L4 n=1 Tax=Spirulina sp. CCNP1310 TaxID=3110249 RepID=UPI002B2216AD|nr:50S ribosomal protein L4 [Spirulina sp. CCNP1310]MEA5418902.1 50S ribosomal protein L4 [Spirulina sp. CCNP1310]
MVTCVVKNWQGEAVGETTLALPVANEKTAAHIVHRALVRQLANARQGTASTKTRAEVRGGGRKPWRQKGTGRARAGSIRSPLWRGGGVIFGPKPRDYSQKMNRKERRLALRTALQSRVEDLVVVQDFTAEFSRPKTKDLVTALSRWDVDLGKRVVLLTDEFNENLYLSGRNIANLTMMGATNLNIHDLLAADKIVATEAAIAKITEVYID